MLQPTRLQPYPCRVPTAHEAQLLCGLCGLSGSLIQAHRQQSVGELEALDGSELDQALTLLAAAELENADQIAIRTTWFHPAHLPAGWEQISP
jgi:hypothetical protein